VVDIIQVLIQQPDFQAARNYWKVLKNRLAKVGYERMQEKDEPAPAIIPATIKHEKTDKGYMMYV